MNEALLNSIVEQVDAHERKIDELHKQGQQVLSDTTTIHLIHTSLEDIKLRLQQASYPLKYMQQLSRLLEGNLQLLKRPIQQEVVHHHHATKIIWATAALFLTVCLLASGWYMTANKFELYKSNDTKYRYLKLQRSISLRQWWRSADSLFIANKNMRGDVLAREEQKQRDIETLQRAMEMEEEAGRLKRQLKKEHKVSSSEERKQAHEKAK